MVNFHSAAVTAWHGTFGFLNNSLQSNLWYKLLQPLSSALSLYIVGNSCVSFSEEKKKVNIL